MTHLEDAQLSAVAGGEFLRLIAEDIYCWLWYDLPNRTTFVLRDNYNRHFSIAIGSRGGEGQGWPAGMPAVRGEDEDFFAGECDGLLSRAVLPGLAPAI